MQSTLKVHMPTDAVQPSAACPCATSSPKPLDALDAAAGQDAPLRFRCALLGSCLALLAHMSATRLCFVAGSWRSPCCLRRLILQCRTIGGGLCTAWAQLSPLLCTCMATLLREHSPTHRRVLCALGQTECSASCSSAVQCLTLNLCHSRRQADRSTAGHCQGKCTTLQASLTTAGLTCRYPPTLPQLLY